VFPKKANTIVNHKNFSGIAFLALLLSKKGTSFWTEYGQMRLFSCYGSLLESLILNIKSNLKLDFIKFHVNCEKIFTFLVKSFNINSKSLNQIFVKFLYFLTKISPFDHYSKIFNFEY
jgi:hypothetical protein